MQTGYVLRNEYLKRLLSNVVPTQGKHLLEPLKSIAAAEGLPFNILEDYNVVNEAEIHGKEGDLWFCLQGEVTFTFGGNLLNGLFKRNDDGTEDINEWRAKEIKGGENVILKPGDWLWIPPGQPHQHRCSGTARLLIIKIPAR